MENSWVDIGSLIVAGITAIAAGFGVVIAWRGVSAWRQQLIGQHDYDLARRLLKGVFETESLIWRLRQVLSADDSRLLWDRIDQVTSDLDVAFLEARVQWGETLTDAKGKLKKCVWQLRSAKRWLEKLEQKPSISEAQREKIRSEHEPIMLSSDDDDDAFARTVAEAVADLEKLVRPHLKR